MTDALESGSRYSDSTPVLVEVDSGRLEKADTSAGGQNAGAEEVPV